MGLEEGSERGKVSRAARVGLDVDTPDGGVEAEGSKRALLADLLNLVDDFVATIVAVVGKACRRENAVNVFSLRSEGREHFAFRGHPTGP